MTTDLWRIDANHDLGGACTLFRRTRDEAEAEAFRLRGLGWTAATRPCDDLPINSGQANWLCDQLWPQASRAEIIHFLYNSKQRAESQLRDVLHRRDERRAATIMTNKPHSKQTRS